MIEEGKRYVFKKQYIEPSMGTINEGREIYKFRNALWMDGLPMPPSYSEYITKLLENKDFLNEYIIMRDFSDSKYTIA